MATTQPLTTAINAKTATFYAEEALTRGVIVVAGTAANEVKLPAGADAGAIVGVVKDDIAIDELGEIYVEGIVPCVGGASITRGDPVSIHASDGQGKTAAPSAGANTYLAGFAFSGCSGADAWFQLEIAKSVMQTAD